MMIPNRSSVLDGVPQAQAQAEFRLRRETFSSPVTLSMKIVSTIKICRNKSM